MRPKYHWAEEFRNGLAFVIFLNEDGKYGKSAIVNKLGEVVSPPGFLMQNFYGDYAVAALGSNKYGVVNRDFIFVIRPEFENLIPQSAPYYSVDDAWSLHNNAPLFYYASKNGTEPPVVLSLRGDVLFQLPKGINLRMSTPYFRDGVLFCRLGSETVYLNLKGQKVDAPYSNLSKLKSVTFRQVAPGVLMKTIECSDEVYKQAVGNNSCTRP